MVLDAQVRQGKIEELWHKFEEIQIAIEDYRLSRVESAGEHEDVESAIIQNADNEREIFESIYYATAAKIQKIILAAQVQQEALRQGSEAQQNDRRQDEQRLDIKLPTLKLQEFKV